VFLPAGAGPGGSLTPDQRRSEDLHASLFSSGTVGGASYVSVYSQVTSPNDENNVLCIIFTLSLPAFMHPPLGSYRLLLFE